MSTPVIEHIAANLATVIEGITTAGGYNQTLTVIRPRRQDYEDVSLDDGVCLVTAGDESPVDSAIGTDQWDQEFFLGCIVLDDDDAETSIDTRINQVKSDIRKALAVEMDTGDMLGGLALDILRGPATKFDDGDGLSGVVLSCVVSYRTVAGDPYTAV